MTFQVEYLDGPSPYDFALKHFSDFCGPLMHGFAAVKVLDQIFKSRDVILQGGSRIVGCEVQADSGFKVFRLLAACKSQAIEPLHVKARGRSTRST